MIDSSEVMKDRRIRFAIQKGEYSRAISLFLQIKFPGKTLDELAKLPKDDISNAQVCIDNAFFENHQREKELAKEMR
jgi:hypothetical protein